MTIRASRIKNKIAKALLELSRFGTPSDMASYLTNVGLRGKRYCPKGCLIANYVSLKVGFAVNVDGYHAYVEEPHKAYVKLPTNVYQLLRDFDRGQYPALELAK